jgi:hypothetical protein
MTGSRVDSPKLPFNVSSFVVRPSLGVRMSWEF